VIHLRCTVKLLRRLSASPVPNDRDSDGRLGDWTAHIFTLARVPVVICVNDRTRLPLLLPLKQSRTLAKRFRSAALQAIRELSGDEAVLAEETAALETIVITRTSSRSILGTINEFVGDCQYWRYPRQPTVADLPELEAQLQGMLCGPLGYRPPIEVARELLRENHRDSLAKR
jgi:hypothetical protein